MRLLIGVNKRAFCAPERRPRRRCVSSSSASSSRAAAAAAAGRRCQGGDKKQYAVLRQAKRAGRWAGTVRVDIQSCRRRIATHRVASTYVGGVRAWPRALSCRAATGRGCRFPRDLGPRARSPASRAAATFTIRVCIARPARPGGENQISPDGRRHRQAAATANNCSRRRRAACPCDLLAGQR